MVGGEGIRVGGKRKGEREGEGDRVRREEEREVYNAIAYTQSSVHIPRDFNPFMPTDHCDPLCTVVTVCYSQTTFPDNDCPMFDDNINAHERLFEYFLAWCLCTP